MSEKSEAILEEVWAMLAHHRKGEHTPEQTLNRLFSENLEKWHAELYPGRPQIHVGNFNARQECWIVTKLEKLKRGHKKTDTNGPSDLPIIVVAYKGQTCLIDGTTRINKWVAEENEELHAVYVLEVVEE